MSDTTPLWSDDPAKGALTWYIKVPDTLRAALLAIGPGRAPAGALRPLHLPTLIALHALLPHDTDRIVSPDPPSVIISPHVLAQATGWTEQTLYHWLRPGSGGSTGGVLRPHAELDRSYFEPDRSMLDDEDDTGLRWVIHVHVPDGGAWMQVPAWWLFARTHHTLLGGRVVERRLMRSLHRSPATGQWQTLGTGMDPLALLGACMVVERRNFNGRLQGTHTWGAAALGARWGATATTAHRALRAAEAAGFLAVTRRTGGRARPAVRTLTLQPTDGRGQVLPVGWGTTSSTTFETSLGPPPTTLF